MLLFSLGHHVLVLNTHNTTTPVSSEGLVIVELSSEVLGEEFQILIVLLSDFSECDAGSGLVMDELSESCLSLDETERNSLLSAKSGEEDQHLNGVDVVSHNNELGFTFFDEGGNVVQTELDHNGLGSLLGVSTTDLGLSFLLESGLLFLLGLGLVLSEQFKELRS